MYICLACQFESEINMFKPIANLLPSISSDWHKNVVHNIFSMTIVNLFLSISSDWLRSVVHYIFSLTIANLLSSISSDLTWTQALSLRLTTATGQRFSLI